MGVAQGVITDISDNLGGGQTKAENIIRCAETANLRPCQLILNRSQPTGSSQAKGKNVTKELTGNLEDCIQVARVRRDLIVFLAGEGRKPVSYALPLPQ